MARLRKIKLFDLFNYSFIFIISIFMFYPVWYILMFSLSQSGDMAQGGIYLVPKGGLSFDVYTALLKDGQIISGYSNSAIVTLAGTTIALLITSMAAFPLSSGRLAGKKWYMFMLIFAMIFNGGLIPTYLVVKQLHLVNTLWALFLPSAVSVYDLLIMIRFFENIPTSLVESACIDGYNDVQIYWKIILPLSKAALAVIGLFYAVMLWNSFLPGIIYLDSPKKWPIQVILYNIINTSTEQMGLDASFSGSRETVKMATAFLAMLPILSVYPFIQKHFSQGVMLGSVKG